VESMNKPTAPTITHEIYHFISTQYKSNNTTLVGNF
jgi:hypothetical protein